MIARTLTHAASWLGGNAARLPLPRPLRPIVWGAFARAYGANVGEAAGQLADFTTFQQFFTRRLGDGRRPVAADARTWVSPVDALWLSHADIADGGFLPIKGNWHSVPELLDDEPAAATAFAGGRAATWYLRPGDYHRIHAPCAMTVHAVRHVPGVLWPVNRYGQKVPALFCKNERLILEATTDHGPLTMIWVGAMMVGSMAFSHPQLGDAPAGGARRDLSGAAIDAGAELGMFRFGSTVIALIAGAPTPAVEPPAEVRVGQPALRWPEAP